MSTPTALNCPDCARCLRAPCDRLRYGVIHPGKYLFVHSRYFPPESRDCPFVAQQWEEILSLLENTSAYELLSQLEHLILDLSPAENLTFDHRLFIQDYNDIQGRVELLFALWQARIFSVIRIPQSLSPEINSWLHGLQNLEVQLKSSVAANAEEGPAITDEMAERSVGAQISMINPRWEHVDEGKRSKSPDLANQGDTVLLLMETVGIPNGAEVVFSIYDAVERTGKKISTAKGRCDNGIASGEWVVSDPGGEVQGETVSLEFDASFRDRTSELGTIGLRVVEFVLSV